MTATHAPGRTRPMCFAPDAEAHREVLETILTLRLRQLARISGLVAKVRPENAATLVPLLERLPELPASARATLARDPYFHASFTRLVTALRASDPVTARTATDRLTSSLLLPAAGLLPGPVQLQAGQGGGLSLGVGGPRLRDHTPAVAGTVHFRGAADGELHWFSESGTSGTLSPHASERPVLDGDDERLPPMLAELAADPKSFSTEHVRPVTAGHALTHRFEDVCDRLRAAWPSMHDEITANVSLVVPIHSLQTAAFSNTAWQGAVFLRDDFTDPLFLAERLVHESSHLRLNAVMAVTDLHTHSWDERVDSPFRNGPRPVAGLLHGAFVFTRAAEALLRISEGTGDAERGARQAKALVEKVDIALRTVRVAVRLTDEGLDFMNDIDRARLSVVSHCGHVEPADDSDYLLGEM